jgi:hypothetical protein
MSKWPVRTTGLRPTLHHDVRAREAVRLNIVRRHLTPSQIAGVLVKSDRLREAQEAARERMAAAGRSAPHQPAEKGSTRGDDLSGKASAAVAKEFGIGSTTHDRAKRGVPLADCSPKCSPQRFLDGVLCENRAVNWLYLSHRLYLTPCVPGNGGPK